MSEVHIGDKSEEALWYAMRVAYQEEMKAKAYCDENGLEDFVPMKFAEVIVKGRKVRKWVPAIHNLVFIREMAAEMKLLKERMEMTGIPVRYMIDKVTNKPMTVPEKEMNIFIAVAGTKSEDLIYLSEGEDEYPKLVSEDRVRVIGGQFEGAEGYVVKVKKDRRVMVRIKGMCAVLTSYIPPRHLEKI
jgi:transcription antitermination factor NusG